MSLKKLAKHVNENNQTDEGILSQIIDISNRNFDFWQNPRGWAPDEASDLLEVARLDWLRDLTYCLKIWIHERESPLTKGEILLARVNLGSLVEGWLKLFYCIYLRDYKSNEKCRKDKNNKIITPNELSFESLRQFSNGVLWGVNDEWDSWVLNILQKRNAIHAFNYREIGNTKDFIDDVHKFYKFIVKIDSRIPFPYR